jgi:hypothetical protein
LWRHRHFLPFAGRNKIPSHSHCLRLRFSSLSAAASAFSVVFIWVSYPAVTLKIPLFRIFMERSWYKFSANPALKTQASSLPDSVSYCLQRIAPMSRFASPTASVKSCHPIRLLNAR